MDNENIVSVILYDTSRFIIGESYRFCLILKQKEKDEDQHELMVGCSNITKLKQIENNSIADSDKSMKQSNVSNTTTKLKKIISDEQDDQISDISSFDKISDTETTNDNIHMENELWRMNDINNEITSIKVIETPATTTKTLIVITNSSKKHSDQLYASRIVYGFDDSFYPGIFIGILITTVFTLIWIAAKITNYRQMNSSTVCYAAANDQHSNDADNHNRYLKLQATTTL